MTAIALSNVTHEEFYRLHGCLTHQRIEDLLNNQANTPDFDDVLTHIQEAKAQYPLEDSLHEVEVELVALIKNLRGNNKTKANEILQLLLQFQLELFHSAEYGKEELTKAEQIINAA